MKFPLNALAPRIAIVNNILVKQKKSIIADDQPIMSIYMGKIIYVMNHITVRCENEKRKR